MKSRFLAILAVALWGAVLFAGHAGAGQPSAAAGGGGPLHKKITQDESRVAEYWTRARMKTAKPVPVAKGQQKSPQAKGGKQQYPYTSYEVTADYTTYPYSTHGKVFFTDNGINYVCSGTAVASANRSTVWTAGHCVHGGGPSEDFHYNWAFVPAYKDGSRPFGTFSATELWTTTGWGANGDFSYDNGAAVVGAVGGSSLTDTVGSRGISFNYDPNQTYSAFGYPAANPFNGQRLWVCEAPLSLRDSSTNPQTLGIGCNMTGGSSGGGWIVGNNIYSVNSYGYSNLRNVMFGPYQTGAAQNLYNSASN